MWARRGVNSAFLRSFTTRLVIARNLHQPKAGGARTVPSVLFQSVQSALHLTQQSYQNSMMYYNILKPIISWHKWGGNQSKGCWDLKAVLPSNLMNTWTVRFEVRLLGLQQCALPSFLLDAHDSTRRSHLYVSSSEPLSGVMSWTFSHNRDSPS